MTDNISKRAAAGDLSGVKRCLEAGEDVDYIDNGRFNETPLQIAARLGHVAIVECLLAAGANVNHEDRDFFSPVTAAGGAENWDILRILAEHGGDFQSSDGSGKSGADYLRQCPDACLRTAIEAILARRVVAK